MYTNYSRDSFRSPRTLSILTVIGLGLLGLSEVLAAGFGFGQVVSPDMVLDMDDGMSESVWGLVQGLLILLQVPLYLFTAIIFLVWVNRTNKNMAPLMARNTEFTSGWAVGWWFVPFASLVKPFQVVREIWWESDPEIDDEPTFLSASLRSAPAYMGVWWAFWLLSNFAWNITGRFWDPEDLSSTVFSGFLFIITGVLSAIAAVLAIMVVRDITDRQEKRFAKLSAMQQFAPPPPPTFR